MIPLLLRIGVTLDAPVLILTTGSGDNTPDFVLTGDLREDDTVRFQYDDDIAFGSPVATTNTIDAAEDAANELDFATGALANGTWYFRARIERPPNPTISDWSNIETLTLSVAAVRSLLAFWIGGAGSPVEVTGGYRSLLAFWAGGAADPGGTPTPPTPEPTPPPAEGGGVSRVTGPHRGPYGRAFPDDGRRRRTMADLYRQLPQQESAAAVEAQAAPEASAASTDAAALSVLSPLPLIMNFGAGPVAIGIEVPYSFADALMAQRIRDDEEALLAILIAAQV